MNNRIIAKDEDFPVQPQHINAKKHLFNAFDQTETEISAGWIIRFLQERNQGWMPFSFEDINAYYSRWLKDGFTFNRLVDAQMVPPDLLRAFQGCIDPYVPVGGGWIIKGNDNKYYVTVDFVTRCFKSSPASKIKVPM